MIRKHITKPVKRWAKEKIKNTYIEFEAAKEVIIHKDPPILYFPIDEESDSFVINKNKDVHELCEQNLPIPPQKLWLGYGKNSKEYLFGKEQVKKMLNIVIASGFDLKGKKRILEFGCGAGRMLRWLKPLSAESEIWGTDISSEHIYWANQYLNPPFNFATTTTIPHLPFEDRYFNFIYCGSVFSHIDDLAIAWLLELKRISSENSLLYVTINDKNSLKLLNTIPHYKELWLSEFIKSNPLYEKNKEEFGLLVGKRGPASQVFYDIDFFCDSVRSFYNIISVNKEAYGFQTGVLLKRKI